MADALSVKIDDLITGVDSLSAAADSIATITSGSDVVVSNFDHVEEVFDNLQDFLTELKAGSWYAPVGMVSPFAGASAPAGWLLCNGDTVPNGSGTVQSKTANYSELYSLLGSAYGSAGKLPDLQGRVVTGIGTNAAVNDRGDSDGISTVSSRSPVHTHTLANHTHTVNSHAHGPGSLWVQFTKGGGVYYSNEISIPGGGSWASGQLGGLQTNGALNYLSTGTPLGGTGTTSYETPGTTGPSNNTSDATSVPYLTLNYIIKA